MKCQSLFSRKNNKKKIINLSYDELVQREVKVNIPRLFVQLE